MEYLLLILGLATLIAGGELLVRGAVGIALKAKVPSVIVGLTIVSFGTSAPELIISLQAVLSNNPDISIGNVIGSNIANLGLVLGLTVIILPMPFEKSILRKDWPYMMGSTVLLWVFLLDNQLSFIEGLLLIIGLAIYILFMIRRARSGRIPLSVVEEVEDFSGAKSKPYWLLLLFLVLSSVGLHFGSEWFLDGAIDIAKNYGLSDRVIGVTIVAFGTSTPELAASVIAAVKKEMDISLGNLVGSNIFNILSVLGITAMIKPLVVSEQTLNFDIYWMAGVALILLPIMLTSKKINRFHGLLLLIIYVLYIYFVL
ncbi:calcium/sodium antiporter [Halocola ammonii]